ncbi:MAG: hypothetical protein ACXACO_08165 [Promethearchaeota archaeon]|jgi:bifunctional DNA-binding transcriptional regulator/antitoxin component of YhaV-PrlF toxin-antitoxin module
MENDGNTTKYRKYKQQGSGTVLIPISLARALKWKDKDDLSITFEVINSHKGIFLFKKEKEENLRDNS